MNSKENRKSGRPPQIWSEQLDLILLECLQEKAANLSHVRQEILEDIVEHSLPAHTIDQCRVRLTKIKQSFKMFQKSGARTKGCYITQKVYEKMEELYAQMGGEIPNQVGSMPPPSHETEKPNRSQSFGTRRIWNDDLDELLLDGLIKRGLGSHSLLRKSIYEEIVQESLPNLTPEQCRDRFKNMLAIYKNKPVNTNKLSMFVIEKLKRLEHTKSNHVKPAEPEPEKQKEKYKSAAERKIWTEKNDLKLLNAFEELRVDATKNIRNSVWKKIAKNFMGNNITAEQCQLRNYKMRVGYRHPERHSGMFTQKVFAKLCEMYNRGLNKVDVGPDPDICRCCGQITNNLIDLDKEADKLEWFLAFTGLAVEQLVRPYTKICQICGEKLFEAQKFRDLCLMGDQIIQTELANATRVEEAATTLVVQDRPVVKPPIRCPVCGEMVPRIEYQQHTWAHTAEETEKARTCPYCGKIFQNLGIYKRHVEYHPDGKIHQCPECPAKYNCAGMLRAHTIKLHKGPRRRYLCPICGKVYEQASALNFHMNKHNGVKPYKCPHCDLRFARTHGMNCHIKSRHVIVRYQCSYCDMKYVQSIKLKQHILLRHEGAILRCDLCGLESVSLKSFNFHLKNVHQAAFNQSVHMILSNGEKLMRRRRKFDDSLIQTDKIELAEHTVAQIVDGDIVGEELEEIEVEAEEISFHEDDEIDIDL